jgi:MYXO-CTERM domain-containing protein
VVEEEDEAAGAAAASVAAAAAARGDAEEAGRGIAAAIGADEAARIEIACAVHAGAEDDARRPLLVLLLLLLVLALRLETGADPAPTGRARAPIEACIGGPCGRARGSAQWAARRTALDERERGAGVVGER